MNSNKFLTFLEALHNNTCNDALIDCIANGFIAINENELSDSASAYGQNIASKRTQNVLEKTGSLALQDSTDDSIDRILNKIEKSKDDENKSDEPDESDDDKKEKSPSDKSEDDKDEDEDEDEDEDDFTKLVKKIKEKLSKDDDDDDEKEDDK